MTFSVFLNKLIHTKNFPLISKSSAGHGKYSHQNTVIQHKILLQELNKVMTRISSVQQSKSHLSLSSFLNILSFSFFPPLYTIDAVHSPGTRRGAG